MKTEREKIIMGIAEHRVPVGVKQQMLELYDSGKMTNENKQHILDRIKNSQD